MLGILSAIVPIFLIVGLGCVLTRAGVFQREHMSVLAAYVVKAALPALVFVNVHGRSLGEILNPTYLLVYALAGMIMVVLARVWSRSRSMPPQRAASMSLAVSGTNNGFVGAPLFLLLIPESAGLAIGMSMLVDNVVIIPLALILFEAASGRGAPLGRRISGIARSVLTHPLIIAIALALVMTGLGLDLPGMLDDAIRLIAQSSSAVALLSIGGMLVGLQLRGQLLDLFATVIAKLLVMPVIALGLVLALPALGLPELSPELAAAALLTCALPSMSIAAALAEQHGEGEFGAAALLLSTVVSFPTLTAWLVVVSALGWLPV